jgi:hypothetical protein
VSATVAGIARPDDPGTPAEPDDADAGGAPDAAPPDRIARVPLVVWLVVATHLVLLCAWSVLLPTFRAPDEVNHVDLVLHVAATHSYPDYDAERVDPGIMAARDLMQTRRRSANLLASEAIPRSRRPSFRQVPVTPATPAARNQMPQHPPLYYAAAAAVFRGVRAIAPTSFFNAFDRQVGLLRLFSALLIAPLPLLAWLVARRVGLSGPASLTAALAPLAIPQLTHLGSAVNNDNLFILLSGILTLYVARLATGDLRTRTVVVASIWCGLLLFTKALAALFPIWIFAAVAVGRARDRQRPTLRDALLIGATTVVFGGWWWIRNVFVFHQISPSIETEGRLATRAGFHPDWGRWVKLAFRNVGKTFFGDFGWYDVWIRVGVMIVAWIVVGIVVAVACFGPRRGAFRRLPKRAVSLLLLAPFLLSGVFTLVNAARLYRQSGQPVLLQGRYLFAGLVGVFVLVGVAVATVGARFPRFEQRSPILMLILAAAMQLLGMKTVINYYWGAVDASFRDRIGALVAWSPWPVFWLWFGGLIGVGVIGVTVVRVVMATRERLVAG